MCAESGVSLPHTALLRPHLEEDPVAPLRIFIAALVVGLAIGVTAGLGATQAAPITATLTNGGFESGFCHWNVSNEGDGAWVSNDGSNLPLSGFPSNTPRYG